MAHHHAHAQGIPLYLVDQNAGQDENSIGFQNQYNINVEWYINCAACCWTYLTQIRNYQIQQGNDTRVIYGQVQNLVQCYIAPRSPQNEHGQFKTYQNDQFGNPVPGLLVRNFSTFRLYSVQPVERPEQIAIGVPVTARIESIAIKAVTDQKIMGSYLSYNNAALCELYRQNVNHPVLPPLQGTCYTTQYMHQDDIKPKMDKITVKQEKVVDTQVDKITEDLKQLST